MQGFDQRSALSPWLHQNGVCQLEAVNEGHSTITGHCDSVNTVWDFLGLEYCCRAGTYCWFSLERVSMLLTLSCNKELCGRRSRVSQQSIEHLIGAVNTEGAKQNISANKMNPEPLHEIHELISSLQYHTVACKYIKKNMADSFPNKNCFCKLWWPLARDPTSSRQLRLC